MNIKPQNEPSKKKTRSNNMEERIQHLTSIEWNESENAVDALKAANFRNSDISVLLPEGAGTKDFAHEKSTKAPEGATTGAGTGALLGGGLGWLLGIGALAIPGLGPFIAAGPIMAALAGAGVGGAVGGFTGALIGMGIPEYQAKRYEGHIKDAEFFCPFTPTIQPGRRKPRKFRSTPVLKMFPRPVGPPPRSVITRVSAKWLDPTPQTLCATLSLHFLSIVTPHHRGTTK